MEKGIKLFEQQKIRSHWDEENEKWLFSIVDIVAALTESTNPQVYWRVLKKRLSAEGNETVTNCNGLKMEAADGKKRVTDVADTEQMLRLIQSIPSPKAEPFKLWLAKVGSERIEESENPELSIDRAMEAYLQKGYSKEWINQRLKSIEVRKELTDEWDNRGVKAGKEFATLTDIITQAWSEKTVKEYKQYKNLKKENLRDHMSNLELVLNMLAEATTTEISKEKQPETFEENKAIAKAGGEIAGNTRKEIESKTGKSIVSRSNAKELSEGSEPDDMLQ
ncbi:Bro-N domain-containing protein [Dyadobacter sp. CY323]|uniref:BRO-N domain-containing protein n=1 Tax=Dyadobacter sp. CY323 TaxID=2907302 RepID=UPI001F4886BF|nr:Bro-N domain-containing protein [Dyadobacter sp. CY323]MCE6988468.1 Bro-N domain-containing protein [Dyadobacter sp. CY323]